MPLNPVETKRAELVVSRNIAKHNAVVVNMSLLHDLSKNFVLNASPCPLFRAQKRDIDSCLSKLQYQQDAYS